jgi:hypothetical protein
MYKLNINNGNITLNGNLIPMDESSNAYQDYYTWLAAGGTLDETEELSMQEAADQALEDEYQLYIKRKDDGMKAYLMISAELRTAKLSGQINEEQHQVIESTLEGVREEVVLGQWIGAKRKLELIGSTLIGETMYNDLHSRITSYISDNY